MNATAMQGSPENSIHTRATPEIAKLRDNQRWIAFEVCVGLYTHADPWAYAKRCVYAIPLGTYGGVAIVKDTAITDWVWVDIYSPGARMLPHYRCARAIMLDLANQGYKGMLTNTWRNPRLARYWRGLGWQEHGDTAGHFSITLD
jgi:hypothetical protein